MQARAHGLAVASSVLCSPDHSGRPIKQEQVLGDCTQDLYPPPPPPQALPRSGQEAGRSSTLDLSDGTISYGDAPSDPGVYGGIAKVANSKLDDILMDGETLSPVATSDPLLSSTSPGASQDSSRKSSISMEEAEHDC